jgi:hypothetical protein
MMVRHPVSLVVHSDEQAVVHDALGGQKCSVSLQLVASRLGVVRVKHQAVVQVVVLGWYWYWCWRKEVKEVKVKEVKVKVVKVKEVKEVVKWVVEVEGGWDGGGEF